jgi:hypothetical protein
MTRAVIRRVTDAYEQLHRRLADAGYAGQNRNALQDLIAWRTPVATLRRE